MSKLPTASNREQLVAKLKPYGQEHLLQFWDELDANGRQRLAAQIEAIDFEQIAGLFHQVAQSHDWAAISRQAEPPPAMRLRDDESGGPFDRADADKRGTAALAAGKIGVLLAAGGQGSRLGFDHPKGLFPIGPVSGASLLQIHLEKALALSRRHRVAVPVYIMTSPDTHDEQAKFLQAHNWFGLPADQVKLFCQGTMPAVDAETGKLLLAEKGQLFLSPDGHGGTLAALAASGSIEDMRRRGIEHLFYLQVDNPLVPIGDALFIGYHLLADSDLTSMAVAKQTPQDRLGNFVLVDGRLQVIEYSDFPDDVAQKRDAGGGLVFWAGSIAVHMFRVAFLRRALALADALPYHIARKKVPFIDEAGRLIEPSQPNALKFERFIFDLLPHAQRPLVVECAEDDVFAPLKNAPGASRDTAEYVQRFMVTQHRGWLEKAGTRVAQDVPVEISPLWALDAQDVAARRDRPQSIECPAYLTPDT
jgi:UDP-N-acetylglucosamine/UDP-N-acetylgalactosamine diphosphorylase